MPEAEHHAERVAALLALGALDDADAHIAAHEALARSGRGLGERRDAAAFLAMRALLAGHERDAREGNELVLALAHRAGGSGADELPWRQRLWVALEWGDEDERFDVLEHCRERAYRFDDRWWRAALVLVLARMGRAEEAGRELEVAVGRCLETAGGDGGRLDMATNLAEAAALVGDGPQADVIRRALNGGSAPIVVVDRAYVCKGSFARYRALVEAATGRWAEADTDFRTAAEDHRRLGAQPLLARTLCEWGRSLRGRDDHRAGVCLDEGAALAHSLHLAGLSTAA